VYLALAADTELGERGPSWDLAAAGSRRCAGAGSSEGAEEPQDPAAEGRPQGAVGGEIGGGRREGGLGEER
jgi:hypothetical protein